MFHRWHASLYKKRVRSFTDRKPSPDYIGSPCVSPLRVRPETYDVFSASWKNVPARKGAEGDAGASSRGLTSMTQSMVTRRALLAMAAMVAFLAGRPALAADGLGGPRSLRSRSGRLTEIFGRRRSACAVGRAYLRQAPKEADPEFLIGAICETDADLRRVLVHGDKFRLRKALRDRVRQDFADGRTVRVDGWLLSRTEARLCALAELV